MKAQQEQMSAPVVIDRLARADHKLPKAAMQWALDHWDEAAPAFVDLLSHYASGADSSAQAPAALFFIIHLLGEKAEKTAYRPLCRLLLDPKKPDAVLDYGITETLPRILGSVCDGDPAPLQEVIEDPEADQYVRSSALDAMAYLAFAGRLPGFDMYDYLLQLCAEIQPQEPSFIWIAWLSAVSSLGYEDLVDEGEALFGRGLIDPTIMNVGHFHEDLRKTLADPSREAGFGRRDFAPMGNTIETLSAWYCFSDEYAKSLAKAARRLPEVPVIGTAAVSGLLKVGRNEPCPCGSGKKYKNCCLRANY